MRSRQENIDKYSMEYDIFPHAGNWDCANICCLAITIGYICDKRFDNALLFIYQMNSL